MKSTEKLTIIFTFIFSLSLVVACISAWVTHIVTCFADAAWGFLIAGAIFFPVAIGHGFYVWFN